MNKTLSQILDAVKDGLKPEYEDLRFAVLALDALLYFESNTIRSIAEGVRKNKKPFLSSDPIYQEESGFQRRKKAFARPPKEWVGESHNPDSLQYQKFRTGSKNILNKFTHSKQGAEK
jgi:hypothetical protein